MTRRRRTEREAHRRVALTDRDTTILLAIGRSGFLATDQLARDAFPSLDRCRSRLRQLFDAGLLDRLTADSRAPDLYRLTQAGLAHLAAHCPEVATTITLPRRAASLAGLTHTRLIGDAILAITALAYATPGTRLVAVDRGRSARAVAGGLAGRGVVPDALSVVASDAGGSAVIAIEADTGTEPLKVLRAKWTAYERCIEGGAVVAELWCVAEGGPARQAAVWQTIEVCPLLAERARFVPAVWTRTRPVSAPPRRGAAPESAKSAESGEGEGARRQQNRAHAAVHPTLEPRVETGVETRGQGRLEREHQVRRR